jgi:hypothetical protein
MLEVDYCISISSPESERALCRAVNEYDLLYDKPVGAEFMNTYLEARRYQRIFGKLPEYLDEVVVDACEALIHLEEERVTDAYLAGPVSMKTKTGILLRREELAKRPYIACAYMDVVAMVALRREATEV